MANKPMNPYATEDFQNAIRKASEDLKKMGEQMKQNFPFMDDATLEEIKHNYNEYPKDESMVIPQLIWDEEEYCGIMRLNYLNGRGAWQDVLNVLIAHGYEVTARAEDATETEKNLDGVEKWIVIEYGEVE